MQLLKIDFAVLDYEKRKNQFAYRISGVQEDWIYTHDQSISIGGFPYGWHLIEIKVQLADGTWSEQIIQIPIEVKVFEADPKNDQRSCCPFDGQKFSDA